MDYGLSGFLSDILEITVNHMGNELHELCEKYAVNPRLASRMYNSLKRSGIVTIEDFIKTPVELFEKLRTIGKKSNRAIMEMKKSL